MADIRSEYTVSLRDDVSNQLRGIETGFARLKTVVAGVGGVLGVGAVAVGAMVRNAADLADNLGKTAQRVGFTVESLSALKHAADLSDVPLESLSGGLQKLSRTMNEAATGSSQAKAAFAAVNVAFKNADGTLRSTDAVFSDVSEALSQLPDGATKTALAMQLFGRSGAELIPLLNSGAKGLREMSDEARQLGVVISQDVANQAQEFNDNLTRLGTAATGLSITLTSTLVGGLANVTTEFVKAYKESSGLLSVFDALGSSLSRVTRGSDQQRLGELLAKEIELEERAVEIEKLIASGGDTNKSVRLARLKEVREELAAVRREAEGLKTVMDPSEFGAAPRAPAPKDDSDDKAKKEKAARDRLLREQEAKAKEQEAKNLAKAEDEYLARLRERVKLEGTSTELAKVRADFEFGAARGFGDPTRQKAEADARRLDQLNEEKAVEEQILALQIQGAEETAKFRNERAKVIEELRTPIQKYNDEINRLMSLSLPEDTLTRGMIEAESDLLDATQVKVKETTSAARELGLTFSSAFEDAIVGGKGLSSVLNGLASDIARILVRKSVTEPLGALLGGTPAGPGVAATEGLFSKLGSSIGSWFGGLFHNDAGGLYRVGGSSSEHAVAFTAKAGEYVAVGARGAGGGAGGVNIVINNNASRADVSAAERNGPNGRFVEITVNDLMARNVQTGRSVGLGLRPALASR